MKCPFNSFFIICSIGEGNKAHNITEEEVKILPYETAFCGGIDPEVFCDISCYEDSNCQTLGYNLTKLPCYCAAQVS